MKKNAFCGILLILAAVIALGSVTVLGPCVHEDGSEALCTGAGRAVFWSGCALAALAILILFIRKHSARIVLFFLSLCSAAAGMMFPGIVFPLCRMNTMHCRAVMQPAMIILFAFALIVSAGGIIVERNRIRRESV
ncbi:MAG: DUF4418 family protein [Clostridia bacterium]|nr:DUF4418 family protein [Clostridia bacterium]MBR4576173.1 DUF4418 family protein [Clostridia bacterium]